MAAPEGASERLRAALAELAEADFDELLVEAQAEARAAVKDALRDAYAQALLARAEHSLATAAEPSPADDGAEALWLYGVVAAGRELPEGLHGVADGRGPRLVPDGELAAVVSAVPLSDFGEQALHENLNDLGWLERMVRAHEAVLEALLAGGAVVPLRVCTIYRGEDQVRALLGARAEELGEALSTLTGRAEWGVKIVADRGRLEERARTRDESTRALSQQVAAGGEGGAYVARKKLEAAVREQTERMLDEVVRETHARLEEWAAASTVLPAQSRELAGYTGEMVFNGAYLVDDERSDRFSQLLGELAEQYGDAGLAFDLTGPWPAHNFSADAADAAGAGR